MNVRAAILDLYNGIENLGMGSIRRLLEESGITDYDVFDVRCENEVPDLSYDIYISTGGPGSPLDVDDKWGVPFFGFLDELWNYNHTHVEEPKHVLLICHSFQMACHHFGVGKISKRKSQSFGVFPVHKTDAGKTDMILEL